MGNKDTFKILSLDGGGIRGLYTSTILEQIEQSFHVNLSECFDLLIGTSTGSIIASAIALDISMKDISNLFIEDGKMIFKKRKFNMGIFKSRYKNKRLKASLENRFCNKTLGDIEKPLMIVSTDILNDNVYIHKSNYFSKIESYIRDKDTRLTDAILASCAAPLYFDPVRLKNDYFVCDGGLWANNPSVLGITEAKSKLGKNMSDICMLSIGTGNNHVSYNKKNKNWGLFTGWKGKKLIECLFSVSSKGATNISRLLLGGNYIRVNCHIEEYNMDNVNGLDNLKSYAKTCFEDNKNIIKNFLM